MVNCAPLAGPRRVLAKWARMRRLLLVLGLALVFTGCGSKPKLGANDLKTCQDRMKAIFNALEMYSADHSGYPDSLAKLLEKKPNSEKTYIEELPKDPSGQDFSYAKTEDGFLLKAAGDYTEAGAEAGFPQLNQDGFLALKPSDFPTPE